MNMFLHVRDAARIEWCDTQYSPALVEGDQLQKFDVVLANPPFSLDKWGGAKVQQVTCINATGVEFRQNPRATTPSSLT
ncbi:N-6 DNA methylase [Falsihalocynthiibacter sp. BN13B15]|uniref:N-6 DNA methylase n=1 Tax=Falsihalocynthiibacter sp. BN13B15 TaxID=3240871 RepID=UPI003510BB21